MPRTTPQIVFRQYIQRLQSAVGCITESRIALPEHRPARLNTIYPAVLNENDPVPLAGRQSLAFSGGQEFRIVHNSHVRTGPYLVTTVQYWYQFALPDGREVLTFHWTPEIDDSKQHMYPHLHVGSGVVDAAGPFLPATFSKLHIPTGLVPIEAIIRFAIEELGVPPIPRNWNERLHKGEVAFS